MNRTEPSRQGKIAWVYFLPLIFATTPFITSLAIGPSLYNSFEKRCFAQSFSSRVAEWRQMNWADLQRLPV